MKRPRSKTARPDTAEPARVQVGNARRPARQRSEERRQAQLAEHRLRESEQRFRSMADAAPVLIWICGPDKRCTWFNKPWLDYVGRTLEQELASGRSVHPEDLERCVQTYTRAFDAHREFRMEYRLRRHDGVWRWILDHGVPLRGPGGIFTGYIGSCVDIHEHKLAESILRKSQDELRTITDIAPVLLSRCSRDLRYLFVNRACAVHLGLPPEKIIGRPIRGILGEAAFKTILPHIKTVLSGRPVEYEAEIAYARSGPRFMHASYIPEKDSQGNIIGWVAAITDITERKQAERRLQLRNAVNRVLAESAALPVVAVHIIETLCLLTDWDVGALWLIHRLTQNMYCVGFWNKADVPVARFEAETRQRQFASGQGVPGQVWSTGQACIMTNLRTARNLRRGPTARKAGLRSGFCVPIKLGDKVLGAFECFSRAQRDLDTDLLSLLSAIGDKLGQFIERKQAEAALQQGEERMRHILQTALDAIIVIEADGSITDWNPQAEQTFGWTRQEVAGLRLADTIIPTRLRAAFEQGLKHYLKTGRGPMLQKRVELAALHRSGREFHVELAITPLTLEDRVSFCAFVRDITERKAAEEALCRHVEEMETANTDLERFNRVAVGRELRMIDLKKEVNELRARAGLPRRYQLEFEQEDSADAAGTGLHNAAPT